MAWNIPGHMLSGAIAYQILRTENPSTIAKVRAILEKHPWYETHWREQLDKLPAADRYEMLFMLASRWADDIRTRDRVQYHQGPWHYVNWPFRPRGQPATVQAERPAMTNIQTALAANEKSASGDPDPQRRAIALTWVFHLVGDVHQPLHTVQMFTTEYPYGDRGGNEICIRPTSTGKPNDLHRFWDGVVRSSRSVGRLRGEATALTNGSEFQPDQPHELGAGGYEASVYEGHEIARLIAYQNGALRGTPKGSRLDCTEVPDAAVLPPGYARIAGHIADRRTVLAGYRLVDLLNRITTE